MTYFNGGNVAFRRGVDALDGFDEYLNVGGARDAPTASPPVRTASLEPRDVRPPRVRGRRRRRGADWGWKYRSLTYRLVKNYNVRPTVVRRILSHAVGDARTRYSMSCGGRRRRRSGSALGRCVRRRRVRNRRRRPGTRDRPDGSPESERSLCALSRAATCTTERS